MKKLENSSRGGLKGNGRENSKLDAKENSGTLP